MNPSTHNRSEMPASVQEMTELLSSSAPDDIAALYECLGPVMPYSQGYWTSWVFRPAQDEHFSLLEGAQGTARMLSERMGLKRGQQLLDIGCGGGGPAVSWAGTTGVTVTGVTLSRWQAEQAIRAGTDAGLGDQVRILLSDAMNLPFAMETFDAAVLNGSLEHMGDNAAVMSNAFRVLRPGGLLAIHDIYWRTPSAAAAVNSLQNSVLPGVHSMDQYVATCRETGFEIVEAEDCTPQSRLGFVRYAEQFDKVLGELTNGSDSKVRDLVTAARGLLGQFQAAQDEDLIGYTIIVARKPE